MAASPVMWQAEGSTRLGKRLERKGEKDEKAKGFYGVIIASTLIGLLMNFIGINPIKALVFAAVFNGVTAVPLLFMINKINANESILGEYKGGKLSRSVIWITFVIMAVAAIGMFYTLFAG